MRLVTVFCPSTMIGAGELGFQTTGELKLAVNCKVNPPELAGQLNITFGLEKTSVHSDAIWPVAGSPPNRCPSPESHRRLVPFIPRAAPTPKPPPCALLSSASFHRCRIWASGTLLPPPPASPPPTDTIPPAGTLCLRAAAPWPAARVCAALIPSPNSSLPKLNRPCRYNPRNSSSVLAKPVWT